MLEQAEVENKPFWFHPSNLLQSHILQGSNSTVLTKSMCEDEGDQNASISEEKQVHYLKHFTERRLNFSFPGGVLA